MTPPVCWHGMNGGVLACTILIEIGVESRKRRVILGAVLQIGKCTIEADDLMADRLVRRGKEQLCPLIPLGGQVPDSRSQAATVHFESPRIKWVNILRIEESA